MLNTWRTGGQCWGVSSPCSVAKYMPQTRRKQGIFLNSFHPDPGMRAFVRIDQHNRIIGTSNPAWAQKFPTTVPPDFIAEQAANVVARDTSVLTFDAERNRIVGYYPIRFQADHHAAETSAVAQGNHGLLLLDYDLAHGQQEIYADMKEDAAVMLSLVALGLLVSTGFAYLFVGRPLRILINTMRKVRSGEIPAFEFRGYGEFAYLGRVIYVARKEPQKTLVDRYGREQRLDRSLEAIAEGVSPTSTALWNASTPLQSA